MEMDPRQSIISKRLVDVKRIIAVSGGKGGTGKSLTAAVLALLLAGRGFRTGLFDLDFGGPSAHVILGAAGIFPEEDKGIIPPAVAGVKFMSLVYYAGGNPAPLRGNEVSGALTEMLAVTRWGALDFLIMDLPPGIGDPVLDIIRFIKRVEFLLVTTRSRMALAVTEKELQVLRELGVPVTGVLENMRPSEHPSVAPAVSRLGVPVLGAIDYDPNLENALGDPDKMRQTTFARQLQKVLRGRFL